MNKSYNKTNRKKQDIIIQKICLLYFKQVFHIKHDHVSKFRYASIWMLMILINKLLRRRIRIQTYKIKKISKYKIKRIVCKLFHWTLRPQFQNLWIKYQFGYNASLSFLIIVESRLSLHAPQLIPRIPVTSHQYKYRVTLGLVHGKKSPSVFAIGRMWTRHLKVLNPLNWLLGRC